MVACPLPLFARSVIVRHHYHKSHGSWRGGQELQASYVDYHGLDFVDCHRLANGGMDDSPLAQKHRHQVQHNWLRARSHESSLPRALYDTRAIRRRWCVHCGVGLASVTHLTLSERFARGIPFAESSGNTATATNFNLPGVLNFNYFTYFNGTCTCADSIID